MGRERPFWVKKRSGGDKLDDGTGVFSLEDAKEDTFPAVVMTSQSIGALGEMVCVCPSEEKADKIVMALNDYFDRRSKR